MAEDGKEGRRKTRRTSFLLFFLSSLLVLVPAITLREPRGRDASLPRIFLWAWERRDDLRRLPRGVGVAFLAQTITISGRTHVIARRRQALLVDDGTPMMAVTRVEAPGDVTGVDVPAIARAIADRARLPMVTAVQIDFDALASQRAMYRRLLHETRAVVPQGMPLSMTALASWCLDDRWLDELPVDEAVPMLFRMGPAAAAVRQEWTRRAPAPKCRESIGVSLDEPSVPGRRVARTYVFNPDAWSAESVAAAVEAQR